MTPGSQIFKNRMTVLLTPFTLPILCLIIPFTFFFCVLHPSHLFPQYFVRDFRVVSRFADKHPVTGALLSEETFRHHLDKHLMYSSLGQENSLIFAAFDFHLHADGLQSTIDPLQILRQVQEEYGQLSFDGNPRYATFSHLAGYGANYYSYLWCRALAGFIWRRCFADDPFSREYGERYRKHMLQPGNGADPWDMLEQLLGSTPSIKEMAESVTQTA